MSRHVRFVLVEGLLAGALAPASGAFGQPAPGLGIRLAEAPASGRDDPRAHIYVVDHVEAGASFDRRIEVTNGTDAVLEPELYVAPATVTDGSFTAGPRGATSELTDWATIEPATVRLEPGGSASATLRVRVPDDAEDGEYYGAALAEMLSDRGGVELSGRVGIRIYLSVGDEAPTVDFEVEQLRASRLPSGEPAVVATVTNTGGRALDMQGELQLSDGPAGLSAGPFPVELGQTLAVGDTQPVRVVLDPATPAGPWEATLTLRSGRLEKSVRATITFPDVGEADVPFTEVSPNRTFPIVVAALLLLLVLAALLWSLLARRPHRRRKRREDAEPAATA